MPRSSRIGILVPFSCFPVFSICSLNACWRSGELLKLYFCRFYSGILCLSLNVVSSFWVNDFRASDTRVLQPCSCRIWVSGSITFSPEAGLRSSKGDFRDPYISFIFTFIFLCALGYVPLRPRSLCFIESWVFLPVLLIPHIEVVCS